MAQKTRTDPLSVLIVDDEAPARRKIIKLLRGDARFEIAGEAEDGEAAVSQIAALDPDVVFLDIQMPGLTGFQVIETIGAERFPRVIFSTAYDQFALRAFEVNAVDYLLKPYDAERFQTALDKLWNLEKKEIRTQIDALLAYLKPQQPFLERLLIKQDGGMKLAQVRDLVRVSAEGKYVRLHFQGRSVLYRESMKTMNARLNPARFVRIHRADLVNLDFIEEMQPWSHGDYLVIMKDGARLILSRRYRERCFAQLKT